MSSPARAAGSARTLITVAPTGAETAKADCPQLPTTLEELVATARACEAAGAAMIHVHIRDAEHTEPHRLLPPAQVEGGVVRYPPA